MADLSVIYNRYLDALNAKDFDALSSYVHQNISYNDSPMSLDDYKVMLRKHAVAIPDLRYDAHLLVASKDHVACRLVFHCTPKDEFLGIQPTGKSVVFAEHVFYRFAEDKIKEVWALLDLPAVQEQLGAS